MSDSQKGKRDKLTGVRIDKTNSNILYLFYTKDLAGIAGVSSSDLQALGHFTGLTSTTGLIFFLNANAPKPPRFKKELDTDSPTSSSSVTTYGSVVANLQELSNSGWKIAHRYIGINLGNTPKGLWVGAELSNGSIYEFNLYRRYFESYGTVLGLRAIAELSDADKAKVCFGSSAPKARSVKKVAGADKKLITFASHNINLTNEWKEETPEITSLTGV